MPAFDEGVVESRVADGRATAADNPGREALCALEHLLQRPVACETEKDDRGEGVTGPDSINDIDAVFGFCTHMFAAGCQYLGTFTAMRQDYTIKSVSLDKFQCAIGI
jgi:hypothetical protein